MSTSPSAELAGLREVLHRPGPVYCAFQTIPDPGVAAILGSSGFDFVVLDAEHGPFSPAAVRGCVDALAPTPAKAAIRVVANDPGAIKQALDLGVDGVQVPMVGDAAEASAAVRASRYSPEGNRGIGTGHAARYGTDLERYLVEANSKVAVLATIETAKGVENAAEIAAVDGLDAIVVGPTDLSADLGLLGDSKNPRVQEAIAHAVDASVRAGTKVGTGCPPDAIADLARQGMTLFACHFDGSAIGASATAAVAAANAAWEKR